MCYNSYVHDQQMLYLYGILIYRNKMPTCVTKYIAKYIKYDIHNHERSILDYEYRQLDYFMFSWKLSTIYIDINSIIKQIEQEQIE